MILCDSIIFVFFENSMLSTELYAFPKVSTENHMGYDITEAVCKMKENE